MRANCPSSSSRNSNTLSSSPPSASFRRAYSRARRSSPGNTPSKPAPPSRTIRLCFFDSSSKAASRSTPASPTFSSIDRWYASPGLPHAATAPRRNDLPGSGITSCSLNTRVRPKPSHVGHAPSGVLNEKRRGVTFGIDACPSKHAWRSEYRYRWPSSSRTTANPSLIW